MSLSENLTNISRIAAADLTGSQFLLMDIDSAGKAALAGAAGRAVGVLQNNPNIAQAAAVGIAGVTKVVAGASFAAGADLQSDAAGKAITFVDPGANVVTWKVGIALTAAGAADEIIDMLILVDSNEGTT